MIECPRCGCKGYHAYDIGPTSWASSGADFCSDKAYNYYYFGVLVICNYCNYERIEQSMSKREIIAIINGASMGVVGHDTIGAVLPRDRS